MSPSVRILALALCVLALRAEPAEARNPWTLDEHVTPDWLSLRVSHRTRFEYLDQQFRASGGDHSDLFALRTLVHGRLRLAEGVVLGAELQDSRAEDADDVVLNATVVNAVELLQAYAEFRREDFLGGVFTARAGRMTMDVGSRRLVARNRYRNTINAFTGVDLEWRNANGTILRGFWTLPVLRLPREQDRLQNNDIRNDEESLDRQFWGLFASHPAGGVGTGELFVFGLHERDDPERISRRRELYTPGFRLFRRPEPGRFDFQVETALQFGNSRAVASGSRLDHFAHFHHAEVGYSFDRAWSPRLALQYDYASGNDDLGDGDNGRFDTLFGARRFDFGPTSIYGAFARANINTPGLRLQLKPAPRLSSFVAVRAYWLAERDDEWTTAGIGDPNGTSSKYIGTQLEMRIRYRLLPGNVMLEVGYAHLFAGEFVEDTVFDSGGDSNYLYTQIVVGF